MEHEYMLFVLGILMVKYDTYNASATKHQRGEVEWQYLRTLQALNQCGFVASIPFQKNTPLD